MIFQIILTSICAAIYFIDINSLHVRWKINYKPFSCSPCLSFWVGAILYFMPQLIVDLATVGFVSGVLGAVLSRTLEKIY